MILKLYYIIPVALFFLSCKKERTPLAAFEIYAKDSLCSDSIPTLTYGYCQFTGVADENKVVFYTSFGRKKNNYYSNTDTGASIDIDKRVYFFYDTAGVWDTIVCIATVKNVKTDIVQDIKEKKVFIYR